MDEVRDSFRSSTWGWLRGTLAGLGTVLLGVAGFGVMVAKAGDWGAWPLVATGLAVLIVLVKWIEYMGAKYEVTEQRLIIRKGIFFKSIDEIELYRIKDIRIEFTIINQIAGIGRITISSSDETTRDGDLVLANVARAQERRETLRRLVDAARQKRRVREIDMHEDV